MQVIDGLIAENCDVAQITCDSMGGRIFGCHQIAPGTAEYTCRIDPVGDPIDPWNYAPPEYSEPEPENPYRYEPEPEAKTGGTHWGWWAGGGAALLGLVYLAYRAL
jgi:hypothetical protein